MLSYTDISRSIVQHSIQKYYLYFFLNHSIYQNVKLLQLEHIRISYVRGYVCMYACLYEYDYVVIYTHITYSLWHTHSYISIFLSIYPPTHTYTHSGEHMSLSSSYVCVCVWILRENTENKKQKNNNNTVHISMKNI